MSRLRRFLFRDEAAKYAAVFRIAIALFWLVRFGILLPHAGFIYGSALLPWGFPVFRWPYLPQLPKLHAALPGFSVSPETLVSALFWLGFVAALLMFAGLFTRPAILVLWLLQYLFLGTGSYYGMDILLHVSLFYLLLMPVHRAFSLDAAWRGKGRPVARNYFRTVLQIHLAIIYLANGLEKIVGEQWWNGEAMYRALNLPHYAQYDMKWLAAYPVLMTILGLSMIALEIFYAFAVWLKKLRSFVLFFICAMHGMIAVFMGLWLFGILMIIINLGAFLPELHQDLSRRARSR